MDPDENLAEQIMLANRIINGDGGDPDDFDRLAVLVLALNNWIMGGEILPRLWKEHAK